MEEVRYIFLQFSVVDVSTGSNGSCLNTFIPFHIELAVGLPIIAFRTETRQSQNPIFGWPPHVNPYFMLILSTSVIWFAYNTKRQFSPIFCFNSKRAYKGKCTAQWYRDSHLEVI